MVSHIVGTGPVIELGAGTGVITKKLSAIDSVDVIYTYENNKKFHNDLKQIDKTVCYDDLFTMKYAHGEQKVKTVISSIPFVNFSAESRQRALESISSVLDQNGVLVQYTYLNKCPFGEALLRENQLELRSARRVWFNFPPATVFVYQRIQSN